MSDLTLTGVRKCYGSVTAVEDFNLEFAPNEFVVLVGPSGCGKSTTLRMVAGLDTISGGTITIGGRVVNHLPPRDRDIAMVFQNYALYPHMNAYDNLAFGLRNRRAPEAQIKREIGRVAEILHIGPLLGRRPKELSGGQQQRVALGRAMIRKPRVFLFDEPLSNLDAKLRAQMRLELKKLRARVETTSLYVTHDQLEAMTLGDRVVVMKDGHIQQIGTPLELYRRPVNTFVASFVGMPAMNFVETELTRENGRLVARAGACCFALTEAVRQRLEQGGTGRVTIGIRPEHIRLDGHAVGPRRQSAPVPPGDRPVSHLDHDLQQQGQSDDQDRFRRVLPGACSLEHGDGLCHANRRPTRIRPGEGARRRRRRGDRLLLCRSQGGRDRARRGAQPVRATAPGRRYPRGDRPVEGHVRRGAAARPHRIGDAGAQHP
jgi:multiple sugar transport system ATP-binding protein